MAAPQPSYLLTGIPIELRRALVREAEAAECSLADVVRTALAEHFGLDPPLAGRHFKELRDGHGYSGRMVIRTTPELFDAIRARADESGTTMKQVIIEVLADHLGLGTQGRRDECLEPST